MTKRLHILDAMEKMVPPYANSLLSLKKLEAGKQPSELDVDEMITALRYKRALFRLALLPLQVITLMVPTITEPCLRVMPS